MEVALPIDNMTTSDKLRAMEELWEALRRTPRKIPSPAWHADVLQAREARVRQGTARFTDWSEAKARLRKRAR